MSEANKKWGSKYPVIMNQLYSGELEAAEIEAAMRELDSIEQELKKYPPDKVVWDIEDLSKQPPWGSKISSDITDLSNYFVTSDGENLIDVLRRALAKGLELKMNVKISTL
ncbi:Imm70 family immunity protein [Butyrivibrio sp. NC2007]|uniref:Imm70 family immunity protein n=1 Tax=Butyrivibrio sp. NC2007 TaxID=1280683 RepID=UPI002418534E|nr:Imm70 family immunity protein [Butyrivibrio sp. NC2007]